MRIRIYALSKTDGRSIADTHYACMSSASNARENAGATVKFYLSDKNCRLTGKQQIFASESSSRSSLLAVRFSNYEKSLGVLLNFRVAQSLDVIVYNFLASFSGDIGIPLAGQ